MDLNWSEILTLMFATIGPLKVTIVAATLTAGSSPEFVKKVALRSVLVASAVCLLFVVLGEAILRLFSISVPAFQIGGGIIVVLFSLETLVGSKPDNEGRSGESAKNDAARSLDIAVYPLAIPLMASVSGLVAIVSLIGQRNELSAIFFLTLVIGGLMAINYLCLRSCQFIVRVIGQLALQVVGKVLGVILVALGVELCLMGLVNLGIIAKTN